MSDKLLYCFTCAELEAAEDMADSVGDKEWAERAGCELTAHYNKCWIYDHNSEILAERTT